MATRIKGRSNDLSPITLFVIIIVSSLLVFVVNTTLYYVLLGLSFSVLLSFSFQEFIRQASIYLFLYVLLQIVLHINLELISGTIIALLALVLKIYPIMNVGRVLILTSPLKIMSALRMLKCPRTVTIALVTALRYIGELELRRKEIRHGMKIRGLRMSLLHPVRSFEIYLIPLIFKSLQVSETLVCSAIARGIEYEGKKTCYHNIRLGVLDYSFLSSLAAIILLWSLV